MNTPLRRRGRGGQRGHEPRARIRTRELRAVELTTRGWSQYQIAADLGISQAAVSKLLKRIEVRLLRDMGETVGRQKARQSLRLEHLFAEAMGAWERSKDDATRRRQRKTQRGAGTEATVAEIVVENQHGDPRYLDEARKALADHRKIWGLDAPQKVDVRASRTPYEQMTDAELRAEYTRQARLLEAGDAPSTDPLNPANPELITTEERNHVTRGEVVDRTPEDPGRAADAEGGAVPPRVPRAGLAHS